MKTSSKAGTIVKRQRTRTYFCDGAGARPDGAGSGFAWVRKETGRTFVKRVDGLTNNQAEYRGLLSVLRAVPIGAHAVVITDSQVVAYQFSGRYGTDNLRLAQLLAKAKALIQKKKLKVEVRWQPREGNLAGRLLEKRKPTLTN